MNAYQKRILAAVEDKLATYVADNIDGEDYEQLAKELVELVHEALAG